MTSDGLRLVQGAIDMRYTLSAPPFDAEKLSANFGFPVPPPFVTLLNALCADCGSAKAACERFSAVLGWDPAGDYMRYDMTPPELFPIAAKHVDGVHFGYVMHAPELSASDHPIGMFAPMDFDGVYLLGATTFEAAETELSFQMQCDQEFGLFQSPFSSEWWPEVAARLRGLGIEPDLARAERNYENGNGKPVTPVIPDGWRHVPSADGIGVLAPARLFHPAPLPAMERQPDVSAVVEAAARHRADQFPATALWLLRECYWYASPLAHDDTITIGRAMLDAYHALGRPSLAAVVSRHRIPAQQMTEVEMKAAIADAIKDTGATAKKDMGR
jgi:hypothetical protein